MPQFLVTAYDGTDADAPARRLAARQAHFEGIQSMVERGEIMSGGAFLGETEGLPIGSIILVEFPTRAELDAWLEREPFVTQKVWQKIEVRPIYLAVRDGKIAPLKYTLPPT